MIAVVVWAAVAAPAGEAGKARYVAVFTDGSRIEGQAITGWQSHPGAPALDATPLFSQQRPLRWFRDLSLAPYQPDSHAPGLVEMVGGDRLIGRVVAFVQDSPDEAAADLPPHLLVQMKKPIHLPGQREIRQVRVRAGAVRRVVVTQHAHGPLPPSTLLLNDGRRFSYRSLRWDENNVRLLTANRLRELSVSEIAEIAFPHRDQWAVYYEHLATLSPDCSARLVRLETTDGLIATGSQGRFRAAATGQEQQHGASEFWYHMVQPAWSLDPIWIHFPTIRTRWYFAPDEVPLSWMLPDRADQPPLLGVGWPWRRDRNVRGGILHAGGQAHGWGFGVRAPQTLWFALPKCASSFRCRAGLDSLAGSGGCVRALVYANEPTGRPLYRSPHMVGSKQVIDTGPLPLSDVPAGKRFLILATDAAHEGRPRGADPLNVRDTMDWIEPLLRLDPAKLKTEISNHVVRTLPGWHGWNVNIDGDQPLRLHGRWDETDYFHHKYVLSAGTGGQTLTLSRHLRIGGNGSGLDLSLRQVGEPVLPGHMEVRIGDRRVTTVDVPQFGWTPRLVVPLRRMADENDEARIVYTPRSDGERIEWYALQPIGPLPSMAWAAIRPETMHSSGGATLTPSDDGSILVSGTSADEENYTLTADIPANRITAFRLEALGHDSLPQGGPGRGADGSFALSDFTVRLLPEKESFEGRYLRIDLPGADRKILSLAEVQVFCGPQNVAQSGTATQSTTDWEGVPERAIDGGTSGLWDEASITHTAEWEVNPWWELDLGTVRKIDRIVLYNRMDSDFYWRLSRFRVTLLDPARKVNWQRMIRDPPRPSVELVKTTDNVVPLKWPGDRSSVEDASQQKPPGNVWPVHQVWAMMPGPETPQAAVFLPTIPIDAGSGKIRVTLTSGAPGRRTLGRFRLSATAGPLPEGW